MHFRLFRRCITQNDPTYTRGHVIDWWLNSGAVLFALAAAALLLYSSFSPPIEIHWDTPLESDPNGVKRIAAALSLISAVCAGIKLFIKRN